MGALLADDAVAVSARKETGLKPTQASPQALAVGGAASPPAPALISRAVGQHVATTPGASPAL